MARFTQYPAASDSDYIDATTFLIANDDGDIKQASLEGLRDNFGSSIQSASLVIPSAQVLALNTTPQTIVAAQGAGKGIEVLSASFKISFNSAAYTTNTTLQVASSGATISQFRLLNALTGSVSATRKLGELVSSTATDTQIIANAALEVEVPSADPVAGDSDIEVFVLYRVIDI